ncbi:hypothetical protein HYC85_010860 [Camellia sinensis]|uniref:Uncharacterized protein n=1 Tax=Camellia sinensis TaxID=4442 RepID=A0A7J7HLU5_CAMSI|nr:hypothetical protein HYC85_010860 [Camellia sinensis]
MGRWVLNDYLFTQLRCESSPKAQFLYYILLPTAGNKSILPFDGFFFYFFGFYHLCLLTMMTVQPRNVFDPRQIIDPIYIDDPLFPTNNVGRNCFRIHQCIKLSHTLYRNIAISWISFSPLCLSYKYYYYYYYYTCCAPFGDFNRIIYLFKKISASLWTKSEGFEDKNLAYFRAFADAYSTLENELTCLPNNGESSARPVYNLLPKIIPSIEIINLLKSQRSFFPNLELKKKIGWILYLSSK